MIESVTEGRRYEPLTETDQQIIVGLHRGFDSDGWLSAHRADMASDRRDAAMMLALVADCGPKA